MKRKSKIRQYVALTEEFAYGSTPGIDTLRSPYSNDEVNTLFGKIQRCWDSMNVGEQAIAGRNACMSFGWE